jgi:hypothetical protein
MTDIGAHGFHRIHAGGEKISVSRSAVVYFLGEFESIFKKA